MFNELTQEGIQGARMKTLVMLMVLSSVAWGQEDAIGVSPIYYPPGIDSAFAYDPIADLVDYWQEYRDSCWADSLHTWTSYSVMSSSEGGISDTMVVKKVWTHPHDPTFPGFMEFLERRR